MSSSCVFTNNSITASNSKSSGVFYALAGALEEFALLNATATEVYIEAVSTTTVKVETNTHKNLPTTQLDSSCEGFTQGGTQTNTATVANAQMVTPKNGVVISCVEFSGAVVDPDSTVGPTEAAGLMAISLNNGQNWAPIKNVVAFQTNYTGGTTSSSCTIECSTVSPFPYVSMSCSAVTSSNTVSLVVSTGHLFAGYNPAKFVGQNSVYAAFDVPLPDMGELWDVPWAAYVQDDADAFNSVAMPLSATGVSAFFSTSGTGIYRNAALTPTAKLPIGVCTSSSGQYVAYLSEGGAVYASTDSGSSFSLIAALTTGQTFDSSASRRMLVGDQTGTFLKVLLPSGLYAITNSQSPPLGTWSMVNLTSASGVSSGGTWTTISCSPSGSTLCLNNDMTSSTQTCLTANATSGGITGSGASSTVTPYAYTFTTKTLNNA